jgi:hypothetical protein
VQRASANVTDWPGSSCRHLEPCTRSLAHGSSTFFTGGIQRPGGAAEPRRKRLTSCTTCSTGSCSLRRSVDALISPRHGGTRPLPGVRLPVAVRKRFSQCCRWSGHPGCRGRGHDPRRPSCADRRGGWHLRPDGGPAQQHMAILAKRKGRAARDWGWVPAHCEPPTARLAVLPTHVVNAADRR